MINKIIKQLKNHLTDYPAPMNLSLFWNFGFLSGICLAIQIISGLFLSMHYIPHPDLAFDSIEHIMRDVKNGWYIRYAHSNGASFFFISLYIHIGRGLYYRSYTAPKYSVWVSGLVIFILTMLTAFVGYVLPWGQMSYWGATVITNLFSVIPFVGEDIVQWIWGGFALNYATIPRFFAIHFLVPFIILALVMLHLKLLHEVGSTNPALSDNSIEAIKFNPYFVVKDLTTLILLLFLLTYFIHFKPNLLGHPDNYIKANPLVTPLHIVPEWYFLPFYAILRSVESKVGGVLLMAFALLIHFIMPLWSISSLLFFPARCRFIYRKLYWFFILNFFLLGWLGGNPVEEPYSSLTTYCTAFYFLYFIILVPLVEIIEQNLYLALQSKKNLIKKKKNDKKYN